MKVIFGIIPTIFLGTVFIRYAPPRSPTDVYGRRNKVVNRGDNITIECAPDGATSNITSVEWRKHYSAGGLVVDIATDDDVVASDASKWRVQYTPAEVVCSRLTLVSSSSVNAGNLSCRVRGGGSQVLHLSHTIVVVVSRCTFLYSKKECAVCLGYSHNIDLDVCSFWQPSSLYVRRYKNAPQGLASGARHCYVKIQGCVISPGLQYTNGT